MSIHRATHEAVIAADKVATLPGAAPAQRLAGLLQLQRHVDGLVQRAAVTPTSGNRPVENCADELTALLTTPSETNSEY